MYPILLEWGFLVIPTWHVFYVLGAFAAYFTMMRLARRHDPSVSVLDLNALFITCYIAGYFGARLLSIIVEGPEINSLGTILSELILLGPMTFYGGAIGSFVAGLLLIKWRKLSIAKIFDLTIPAGLLALAIGRLGCFFNGDDYGRPLSLGENALPPWWAVTFPNLNDGLPRYPIQLIEAGCVGLFVLALMLTFSFLRRTARPGAVGFAGVIAYANLRFFIEFWRDDFRGSILVSWLSTSQFISIVILCLSAIILPFWLRMKKPQLPAAMQP